MTYYALEVQHSCGHAATHTTPLPDQPATLADLAEVRAEFERKPCELCPPAARPRRARDVPDTAAG